MTKLKLKNPWKDEVDNRLHMSCAILEEVCGLPAYEIDLDVVLAALTLVNDARSIFEEEAFKC